MNSAFGIARIHGVEVRIHWTWLIVLAAITAWMGGVELPAAIKDEPAATYWLTAIGTSALVFLSVAAHELAHVAVARHNGVGGPTVVVQLLGGPYVLETSPKTPGQELRVAAAGPFLSVLLAVAFGAFALATASAEGIALAVSLGAVLVCGFNFFLAIVSLIPGYPMDGGRIVRSVVWRTLREEPRATAVAARIGRYAGYALILLGLVATIFDTWTGLIVVLGGWMLASGGRAVERREFVRELVAGLRVRDAIEADTPHVPAQLTLDTFAGYLDLPGGAIVVERATEPVGVLGSVQARRAGRRNWARLHAEQVMTPISDVQSAGPDTDLWTALELMERTGTDALQVPLPDAAVPAEGEGEGDERPLRRPALLTRRSAAARVHKRAEERLAQTMARRGIRFVPRRGPALSGQPGGLAPWRRPRRTEAGDAPPTRRELAGGRRRPFGQPADRADADRRDGEGTSEAPPAEAPAAQEAAGVPPASGRVERRPEVERGDGSTGEAERPSGAAGPHDEAS